MQTKLTEMLTAHEGSKSHAYKCTAGKITVGVGRNIDPEGGLGLSQEEITYLLSNDIWRIIWLPSYSLSFDQRPWCW